MKNEQSVIIRYVKDVSLMYFISRMGGKTSVRILARMSAQGKRAKELCEQGYLAMVDGRYILGPKGKKELRNAKRFIDFNVVEDNCRDLKAQYNRIKKRLDAEDAKKKVFVRVESKEDDVDKVLRLLEDPEFRERVRERLLKG